MAKNKTIEDLLSRRSIRSFKRKPIGEENEELLLKAAMAAPSAGNLQSRFFYFVRDEETLNALRGAAFGQECLDAPLIVVACADLQSAAAGYGQRGENLYSIQDTATSVENMMIAAASLGLGSCWVGAFDEEAVRSALSILADLRPVALMPVGFPNEKPGPRRLKTKEQAAKFV